MTYTNVDHTTATHYLLTGKRWTRSLANCFTSVMAGGGIRGGQIYGASDQHAAYPALNPVNPIDLAATVYDLIGVPPNQELTDIEGRPFVICPGNPIRDLMI